MPSALRKLDLVLGCFHSALRRVEDQTSRYMAALHNPDIQVLGHPQTRIYDKVQGSPSGQTPITRSNWPTWSSALRPRPWRRSNRNESLIS